MEVVSWLPFIIVEAANISCDSRRVQGNMLLLCCAAADATARPNLSFMECKVPQAETLVKHYGNSLLENSQNNVCNSTF